MPESTKQSREGSVKSKTDATVGESDASLLIGVYFLHTAGEGSSSFDLACVAKYAATLPGVSVVRTLPSTLPLHPDRLAREIRKEMLHTIVVASEQPGFFKAAF